MFCAEKLQKISSNCLDFIGASAACDSHWANDLHKEVLQYLSLQESKDSTKYIVSLLGLQHAGVRFWFYFFVKLHQHKN